MINKLKEKISVLRRLCKDSSWCWIFKKVIHILYRCKNYIIYNEIVILNKKISTGLLHDDFFVNKYESCDPDIHSIYLKMNAFISQEMLSARCKHGMQFYELKNTKTNETVAFTWIIQGDRFIDEAGYHIKLKQGALWVRDINVAPQYRGQRIFSVFLNTIINRFFSDSYEVFSDVEPNNKPSIRAHLNYGFVVVDSLKVLRLARIIIIRIKILEQSYGLCGIKPGSRWLFTGRDYYEYRENYLA